MLRTSYAMSLELRIRRLSVGLLNLLSMGRVGLSAARFSVVRDRKLEP